MMKVTANLKTMGMILASFVTAATPTAFAQMPVLKQGVSRKVLVFDVAQSKKPPTIVTASKNPGSISDAPIMLGEPAKNADGFFELGEKSMLLDAGKKTLPESPKPETSAAKKTQKRKNK